MSLASDSSPPHAGDVLGDRYLLRERIGAGGMGRVFRARDHVLERDVAIKIFFADRSDEPEPLRRLSEARALAALDHPSLVTLYDARLTGEDHVYLVMELVEGPSLQRRIEQGPIPATEVAGILRDLADALCVVHAAGIVHRDIKPSNVLLRPFEGTHEAVLADFGVAHLVDATRLTTPGTVIGTAAYLAPEQVRGDAPQPASDIYALGLLGIEALTRLHPFGVGSLQETLLARLARQPDVPGEFGYGWRALLTAMTTHDPAARPTAAMVVERAAALARVDDASLLAEAPVTEPSAGRMDASLLATRALTTHEPDAEAFRARAVPADAGGLRARAVPANEADAAAWVALGLTPPVEADDAEDSRSPRRSRRRAWVWVGAAAGAALLVVGHIAAFSLGAAGGATTDRLPHPSPSTTVSEQPLPAGSASPATVEQASTTTDDRADAPQDDTVDSSTLQPIVAVPVGSGTGGGTDAGAGPSGSTDARPADGVADASNTSPRPGVGNGNGNGAEKKADAAAGKKPDTGAGKGKGGPGGKDAQADPSPTP